MQLGRYGHGSGTYWKWYLVSSVKQLLHQWSKCLYQQNDATWPICGSSSTVNIKMLNISLSAKRMGYNDWPFFPFLRKVHDRGTSTSCAQLWVRPSYLRVLIQRCNVWISTWDRNIPIVVIQSRVTLIKRAFTPQKFHHKK